MEPEEEVNEEVAGLEINNLRIEMAVTEEEAKGGLEVDLGMEVEGDRGSEGEEEGGGTQRALEALEFLTQEVALRVLQNDRSLFLGGCIVQALVLEVLKRVLDFPCL